MSLRLDGRRTLRAALLALALAVAPVAAGCSGDDGDSPSSADVPEGSVATVGDVEIGQEQLDSRVEQLARAQRGRGGASPSDGGGSNGGGSGDGGSNDGDDGDDDGSDDGGSGGSDDAAAQQREQLEAQALASLLQEQAIEQEAADRGIEVDDSEVRRRWRAASGDQFQTERALRRFLGGQTVADVLRQLRLQELTERIHADVREQADGNPDRAVARFQREFRERWESRTACAERYSAAGCADDG